MSDARGANTLSAVLGAGLVAGFGAALLYQRKASTLHRELVKMSRSLQVVNSTRNQLEQQLGQAQNRARQAVASLAEKNGRLQAESARKSELATELMGLRNARMHDPKATERGTFPQFVARDGDVFVVTYPKCGTTWMTHIVHGLRSGGNLDFGEIQEVVPWDILADTMQQDLDADHTNAQGVSWPFRAFKSHESFATVARSDGVANTDVGNAKYIYVIRDPRDAFLSFHKFLPGYVGLLPTDIDQQSFCNAIFGGASHSGGIWDHLLGWFPHRHNPNVLFVCFETMVEDLEGSVALVAKFCGLGSDDDLVKLVARQSTHKFMTQPDMRHHFDDHFIAAVVRKVGGVCSMARRFAQPSSSTVIAERCVHL
eukprot:INCI2757.2.p1 GENE.INCI2757.2~~INCI2757.2.p1  ORF type:complete len:378 (-),score=60.79 INCI2757.2:333-1442(-)